jgi:hypothetical protein
VSIAGGLRTVAKTFGVNVGRKGIGAATLAAAYGVGRLGAKTVTDAVKGATVGEFGLGGLAVAGAAGFWLGNKFGDSGEAPASAGGGATSAAVAAIQARTLEAVQIHTDNVVEAINQSTKQIIGAVDVVHKDVVRGTSNILSEIKTTNAGISSILSVSEAQTKLLRDMMEHLRRQEYVQRELLHEAKLGSGGGRPDGLGTSTPENISGASSGGSFWSMLASFFGDVAATGGTLAAGKYVKDRWFSPKRPVGPWDGKTGMSPSSGELASLVTKDQQLAAALRSGEKLTTSQIQERFGYATPNSARAAVSRVGQNSGGIINEGGVYRLRNIPGPSVPGVKAPNLSNVGRMISTTGRALEIGARFGKAGLMGAGLFGIDWLARKKQWLGENTNQILDNAYSVTNSLGDPLGMVGGSSSFIWNNFNISDIAKEYRNWTLPNSRTKDDDPFAVPQLIPGIDTGGILPSSVFNPSADPLAILNDPSRYDDRRDKDDDVKKYPLTSVFGGAGQDAMIPYLPFTGWAIEKDDLDPSTPGANELLPNAYDELEKLNWRGTELRGGAEDDLLMGESDGTETALRLEGEAIRSRSLSSNLRDLVIEGRSITFRADKITFEKPGGDALLGGIGEDTLGPSVSEYSPPWSPSTTYEKPENESSEYSTGGTPENKVTGTWKSDPSAPGFKEEEVNERANKVMDFFVSKGVSREIAAGFVGNMMIEAPGIDPGAYNKAENARGIAQWHKNRWDPLVQWAQSQGHDPNTLEGQLEMYWHELQTSEKKAWDKIRKAKNPSEAASLIDSEFERSSGEHRNRRIDAANTAYTLGTAEYKRTPIRPSSSGATSAEELINAGVNPKFAKNLASKINSLDPSVRGRYRDTVIDFYQKHGAEGYDLDIDQATRTVAEQNAIIRTGVKAASPRNTWHVPGPGTEGGAAVDFKIFKNGVLDAGTRGGNAYETILAPVASEHGLNNPISNDVGHFMAVELPKSRGGRSPRDFIDPSTWQTPTYVDRRVKDDNVALDRIEEAGPIKEKAEKETVVVQPIMTRERMITSQPPSNPEPISPKDDAITEYFQEGASSSTGSSPW